MHACFEKQDPESEVPAAICAVLKLRRKLLILQFGGLPRKQNFAYITFSNIRNMTNWFLFLQLFFRCDGIQLIGLRTSRLIIHNVNLILRESLWIFVDIASSLIHMQLTCW